MGPPIRLTCGFESIRHLINKLKMTSSIKTKSRPYCQAHLGWIFLCIMSTTSAEEIYNQVVDIKLDWKPVLSVKEAERDRRCLQCGGKYEDLSRSSVINEKLENFELEVVADDTEVTETELIFLGNVHANQGNRNITASVVRANRLSETAVATGNVKIREPGILLTGEEVSFDGPSEHITVTGARFVLHQHHMTGSAQKLIRDKDRTISIEDGSVTFCSPDDPTWVLQTDTLRLEPDSGTGQAWGARLKVAGVPVLYLPWIRFPVDSRRKTGLLFPDLGSDTRGGIDITTPIYLNLAPNYDFLYSPRYIQERGVLQQGKIRLLDPRAGRWEIAGAWLGNDTKYNENGLEHSSARWLTAIKHSAEFDSNWATYIKYAQVSDPDYIRDLENNTLSAQRQTALQQIGRVRYMNDAWFFEVEAEQFQSIANDIAKPYKKLPQITARFLGKKTVLGLHPIFYSQLSRFDSDRRLITGERLYSEVGVHKEMRWSSGFINSTVKYRSVNYKLNSVSTGGNDNPHAGAWTFNLDSGLLFERQTIMLGQRITQTLEPRIYYLFNEDRRQPDLPSFDTAELTFNYSQLYRDTRFSGHDRVDDANQISFGVTTRIFDYKTGKEKFNASLGQILYFENRNVRLHPKDTKFSDSSSPIVAELNWALDQHWNIRTNLLFDRQKSEFDAAYAQVTYRPKNGLLLNAGYALRKPISSRLDPPITEQINISAFLPINFHWSFFGALKYSIEASESVEDMFGIEYDDCCWRIRALYMRYLETEAGQIPASAGTRIDRENAIQLQIVLKGMGGFGSRVDRLLKDMVLGFQEH